ncbi:MAG: CoA-binding protein, partial [Actinomycetospora chiangmaiensis]|nr:CoA-binding protein [Actinomycetospora chiangmaiensis]
MTDRVDGSAAPGDPGSLDAALDPRSVAVIGASDNPDKIGGRPLLYLSRFGFRGTVHPVNPRGGTIQGLRAVPRVADLDQAPDVAIIAVPGEAAVAA